MSESQSKGLLAARVTLLVFAVVTCATAVIMIKKSHTPPILLASYRQLVAAVLLLPVFWLQRRKAGPAFTLAHVGKTVLPGVLLGAHFITWVIGARLTPAAQSNLVVNMLPIATPFLLYAMVRERLTAWEWGGTALALIGQAVVTGKDFFSQSADYPNAFQGDVLCFVSMLLLAGYMVLARRNRDFPGLWLYVVPLYFVGGLFCLAAHLLWQGGATIFFGQPFIGPLDISHGPALAGIVSAAAETAPNLVSDLKMILGLALIPTIIGHTVLNYSMRHIRGQAVGIITLSQFIFAGILAYFLLEHEVPGAAFYVASALVVAGAAMSLLGTPRAGEQVNAELVEARADE